ncbi:MAG: hypothetical protein ABEH64_12405 [Salinirussus sp.]
MSKDTNRPFSRFYAQLLREAGEDVEDADDRLDFPGVPELANPRRGSEADR